MTDIELAAPKTSAVPGMSVADMATVSRSVLDECVRLITGRDDLPPRTGQVRLLGDLVDAFTATIQTGGRTGGQVQGEAPTGIGKSFSYLVPAAVARALGNQRTVVSTEMISLQTQLIDKDAPIVAQAMQNILGFSPKAAVLKGWSNYACTQATVDTAERILDLAPGSGGGHERIVDLRAEVAARNAAVAPPRKGNGAIDMTALMKKLTETGARDVSAKDRDVLALVEWALDEAASFGEARPDGTGDKNTFTGSLADSMMWDQVSVSSSDCIGASKCAFADQCLPARAKEKAAEADIVVTNHHLLAVQAANGVPVVLGSVNLGEFHHIIVDEAHGLPSIVRNQGAVEVSSRIVRRAARAVGRIFDENDPKAAGFVDYGEGIADRLEEELAEWTARCPRGEDVLRLGPNDDPINDTAGIMGSWVEAGKTLVSRAEKATANVTVHMKARRARNALDALAQGVKQVSEHEVGAARWVETVTPHRKGPGQKPYAAARYTPVNVSSLIKHNLWTVEDPDPTEDTSQEGLDEAAPRRELTVVALSATLPKGFGVQAGLRVPVVHYESPFDDAYGSSVLYVPRAPAGSADMEALRRPGMGKPRFDTGQHTKWATEYVLDLVAANGGSALVLAATASAGRAYVAALQNASGGRWNVLSQWDGPPLRTQIAAWKDDVSSVLVGTKSLMTGVDAAGDTCSLTIIDRPARARSNPVDDARVEGLMEALQMDKWAADRLVYVADAAALLSQSAGRLIRQVSDSGMVAVLDPRLLKSGPYAYQHATRADYLEALHRFETRIADRDSALAWLGDRSARAAKAS